MGGVQTLVAAIRSILTYVTIVIYVIVVAPVGMLLAIVFGWKSLLYALGHGGVRLALALAGIRYRVRGREHLVDLPAAVFCSNHQSNVDPAVLFEALHPRLHILYKAELQSLPILGRAFKVGGFIPIDRGNRDQSAAAIEAGAQSIRAGNSFLIFPEGTRSRTDKLLPFKKGGFIMALRAQAPIVPVAVQGGTAAMRKGSAIIRPVTVDVQIGEPVETAGLSLDQRDDVIATVRRRIEGMLAGAEDGRMETETGKTKAQ
jgi:1-acyl-sn-glycerol-3-phosphate acyltransferase